MLAARPKDWASSYRSCATLEKVINNIRASYSEKPRKIHMIYFNNGRFEKLKMNRDWLVKKYQADIDHVISYGLYETIT